MRVLLVDTEGTLFDNTHRQDLFKAGLWEEYEAACVNDTIIEPVAALLRFGVMDQVFDAIHIVTPRYEKYQQETMRALLDARVSIDDGLFRDALDSFPKTKEPELKLAYLETIKQWYPHEDLTIVAWEDRDDCVNMYRNAGVMCWQVAAGVLG